MTLAAAVDLRRLKSSLIALGLDCSLPPSGGLTRLDFILLTLLKLKRLIGPPRYAAEETILVASADGADAPLSPGIGDGHPATKASAAGALEAFKTEEDKRQLLKHLVDFMQQRVGIALHIPSLIAADGSSVSELCRLTETLAEASRAALKRQQQACVTDAATDGVDDEGVSATLEETSITSDKTVERIEQSAAKLLSSIQWFYGEAQVAERRAAESFLDDLLGCEGGPMGGGPEKELPPTGGPQGPPVGRPSPDDEKHMRGRALLLQRLEQVRNEVAEGERRIEVLENQIKGIKTKIETADNDAERLKRQLLLLKRGHGSNSGGSDADGAADTAAEDRVQRQQQQLLRELYVEYARRSAVCDALMASVEDLADRAEAAEALSRRRMHEAARQRILQQEAAAAAPSSAAGTSAAYSHTSAMVGAIFRPPMCLSSCLLQSLDSKRETKVHSKPRPLSPNSITIYIYQASEVKQSNWAQI
ncbi:hypothetical protein ACSSS7_007795 [Eimeria intestinalis]